MRYEHRRQQLAPRSIFYRRVFKNLLIASLIMTVCLVIGMVGYHYTDSIPWLDALHNASMILSGMGPVVTISSDGGKWFSSAYALFSGIIFITNVGVILAPAIHRLYHRMHIEEE